MDNAFLSVAKQLDLFGREFSSADEFSVFVNACVNENHTFT